MATLLRLPKPVSDWIAHFDAGRPVNPVKFDVELAQSLCEMRPGVMCNSKVTDTARAVELAICGRSGQINTDVQPSS